MDAADHRIAYVSSSTSSLQELFELDVNTGEVTKLTDFNGAYVQDTTISIPERVDYESEGKSLQGWGIKPVG